MAGFERADISGGALLLRCKVGAVVIDRQSSKILIECDSCSEVFEGNPHEEFQTVWVSAKNDGWRTRQIAGEWLHGCPKCGVPDMKLEPYKSQPLLYRAIGGDEYAAIITDLRPHVDGVLCSVATFMPMGGVTNISRVKYFGRKGDAADHRGAACYPAI